MKYVEEDEYSFVDPKRELLNKIKNEYKNIKKRVDKIDQNIALQRQGFILDFPNVSERLRYTVSAKTGFDIKQYVRCNDQSQLDFYKEKLVEEVAVTLGKLINPQSEEEKTMLNLLERVTQRSSDSGKQMALQICADIDDMLEQHVAKILQSDISSFNPLEKLNLSSRITKKANEAAEYIPLLRMFPSEKKEKDSVDKLVAAQFARYKRAMKKLGSKETNLKVDSYLRTDVSAYMNPDRLSKMKVEDAENVAQDIVNEAMKESEKVYMQEALGNKLRPLYDKKKQILKPFVEKYLLDDTDVEAIEKGVFRIDFNKYKNAGLL